MACIFVVAAATVVRPMSLLSGIAVHCWIMLLGRTRTVLMGAGLPHSCTELVFRGMGVPVIVSPHRVRQLDHLRMPIRAARTGWDRQNSSHRIGISGRALDRVRITNSFGASKKAKLKAVLVQS